MVQVNRFKAFISYSNDDEAFAKRLHRDLEGYRVPRRLTEDLNRQGKPTKLHPIFRDREELPATPDLRAELFTALEASEFLIVVCSPSTPKSVWVNDEIERFKKVRKAENIISVITDNCPRFENFSDLIATCFPTALLRQATKTADHPAGDVTSVAGLSADARRDADGRIGAKLKIASALLKVSVGVLKDREIEREKKRTRFAASVAGLMLLLVIAAVGAAVVARLSATVANERLEAAQISQTRAAMEKAITLKPEIATSMLREVLPADIENPNRPLVPEALDELSYTLDLAPNEYILSAGDALSSEFMGLDSARKVDRIVTLQRPNDVIKVWEIVGDKPRKIFEHASELGRVHAAAISGDGNRVLAATDSGAVVYDLAKNRQYRLSLLPNGAVARFADISDDGTRAVIGSFEGNILAEDINTGKNLLSSRVDDFRLEGVYLSSDGDIVVADLKNRDEIVAYSALRRKEIWRTETQGNISYLVDSAIYLRGFNSEVGLDLYAGKALSSTAPLLGDKRILGVSSDKRVALLEVSSSTIETRRLENDAFLGSKETANDMLGRRFAAISSSGRSIIYGSADFKELRIAPTETDVTDIARSFDAELEAAAFSPDGETLAVATKRGTLSLYKAPDWQILRTHNLGTGTPILVAVGSGDRHFVVTRNSAALYESGADKPRRSLEGLDVEIVKASVDEGLGRAILVLANGKIMDWNLQTGQSRMILDLAAKGDGLGLFSGSYASLIEPMTAVWVSPSGIFGGVAYNADLNFFDGTGKVISHVRIAPEGEIRAFIFRSGSFDEANGRFSVALDQDGWRVIDVVGGRIIDSFVQPGFFAYNASFLSSGKVFLHGSFGQGTLTNFAQIIDAATQQRIQLRTYGPPFGAPAAAAAMAKLGDDAFVGLLDSESGYVIDGPPPPRYLTVWSALSGLPVRRVFAGYRAAAILQPVRLITASRAGSFLVLTPEGNAIVASVELRKSKAILFEACRQGTPLPPEMKTWLGLDLAPRSESDQLLDRGMQWLSIFSRPVPEKPCQPSELAKSAMD